MSLLSNFPFPALDEPIPMFGIVHLIIVLIGTIICIALYYVCKKYLKERGQRRVLWIMWFTICFFVLWNTFYKSLVVKIDYLNKDSEYYNPARWLNEIIPLTLCRINFFVLFFALVSKKDSARAYAFFVSMIGGALALIIMVAGRDNYIDYFITHFIYVFFPIFMVGFGFYTPRLRDLKKVLIFASILLLYVHISNSYLTRLSESTGFGIVNNILTLGSTKDSASDIAFTVLFNIFPVPYFYLFLFGIPIMPIWCALSAIFIKKNDDIELYKSVPSFVLSIPSRIYGKIKGIYLIIKEEFSKKEAVAAVGGDSNETVDQ